MHTWIKRMCAALACCVWALAQGQPVVEVPADNSQVSLNRALDYLIDDTGQWRPGSGVAPPGNWQALMSHAGKDHFGFIDHPVWFRVSLRSASAGSWVWMVDLNQFDHIDWMVQRADRPAQWREAGLAAMQAGRVPPQRHPTLTLALDAGETVTVYMRVQTTGIFRLDVVLQEASAWQTSEAHRQIGLGAYFGLLAGLLTYNGFLALRMRESAYGYYVGFGIHLGLFQLCSTGFGPMLLWTDHATLTYRVVMLAGMAAFANALMFTDSFLRARRLSPKLSAVLRCGALVWLLMLLSTLGAMVWPAVPLHWLVKPTLPMALCTVTLIMVSGTWARWRGVNASGIFLLAWSGVLVALFARSLNAMGLVPINALIYDGLLLASASEMVLLSLALADRMTAERRARAEADLQRAREQAAREQAQHALEDKTRFMASVTHDLQQPLYALSLATESMARGPRNPQDAAALDQMRSAMHSADELLATLALNVRLERAELQPDFKDFSVQEMIERIEVLFASRAQAEGLRWRVLPSLAIVRSDPLMLERMVCNLVSNAMRYTRQGGVLLSCRARTDHLLIQVWDTGPGIAEHEQASIFEAYQRGSAAQWQDQGLGLGLSIVSRCAKLLAIRLRLRSVSGRGSCFSLYVPLAPQGPINGVPR